MGASHQHSGGTHRSPADEGRGLEDEFRQGQFMLWQIRARVRQAVTHLFRGDLQVEFVSPGRSGVLPEGRPQLNSLDDDHHT